MDYTYNDIVPDWIQNELIQIRDTDTLNSWRLGELTWMTYQDCKARGLNVEKGDIYRAVGALCGKSARTVREYATVRKFYNDRPWNPEWDILSFEHFRIAARLGDNWSRALGWCVEQVEKLGRPATVDAMLLAFLDRVVDEEATPLYTELKSVVVRLKRLSEKVSDERLRDTIVQLVSALELALDSEREPCYTMNAAL